MNRLLTYLFVAMIAITSSCKKDDITPEVVKEDMGENGVKHAAYYVKSPVETITESILSTRYIDDDVLSLVGQKTEGNKGPQWIHIVSSSARLSSVQAVEDLRRRGYEPAGVGYLLALANEYKSSLGNASINCVNTGNLKFKTWNNEIVPLRKISIRNDYYDTQYTVYGPKDDLAEYDLFYLCFKK